jgi:O-methyltransferase
MKQKLKTIINSLLKYVNLKVVHRDTLSLNKTSLTYATDNLFTYNNADFLKDKLFAEAYDLAKKVDNNRLLKNLDIQWRLHILCASAYNALKLEGDFVECGVGSGIFSRAIIHYTNFQKTEKKFYLLDTFNGLDSKYSSSKELLKSKSMDYHKSYEEVLQTFKGFNTKIIMGSIPETLSMIDTEKICFLSIDMNAAIPEQAALAFLWNRIVPGGYIIFDDYGYGNQAYIEQKKVHDFFAKSKQQKIFTLPTGQGLLIKTL